MLRKVLLAALLAAACPVREIGQETVLRSKSELVLVPVSISDRRGQPVRDLTEEDLTLYDDNVPQRIHLEDITLPVSLAIAVQTTPDAQIVLDKLRKSAGAIGPLVTGFRGEAAVVAFGKEIEVVQPFTANEDEVARAIRRLDATGESVGIADGVTAALNLLAARPAERRRVLLLISEKHDLGTDRKQVAAVVLQAQKLNVTVYSVTYSPSATQFTNKTPVYCDPPASIGKCVRCTCGNCGNQCDREDGKPQPYTPVQAGYTMNLGALVGALAKATKANAGELLAQSTGGEQTEFLTKAGLDGVIERIGRDVHSQYLISFQPAHAEAGRFHKLRIEVKGRRDLVLRSRPGYWPSGE